MYYIPDKTRAADHSKAVSRGCRGRAHGKADGVDHLGRPSPDTGRGEQMQAEAESRRRAAEKIDRYHVSFPNP